MHDSTAPNTSPRNSEAPLAIFGCAVKPGSDAMKTMTLTTRLMAESAPTYFLMAARAFSAHCRAAAYPSSSDTAPPSLPGVIS